MGNYDVFIAYAGPNAGHAETLYNALTPELGRDKVFFDKKLPIDANWYREISAALDASRMLVVVLTRAPDRGWWDVEEILAGIADARRDELSLVPYYVDGRPRELNERPYGLRQIHGIDGHEHDLETAAGQIGDRIRELTEPAPSTGVVAEREPETYGDVLESAFHLDRTSQWAEVSDMARQDGHLLTLLHGETFQNVGVFLHRIQRMLTGVHGVAPHLIAMPRYRIGTTLPESGDEWVIRVRDELAEELHRGGTPKTLLRAATRNQHVFLLTFLEASERFDNEHRVALREFLETKLPALLTDLGGYGVRFLLAADHLDEDLKRVEMIEAAMRAAEAASGGALRYCPTTEISTPSRGDLVKFLKDRHGLYADHPDYRAIMTWYDARAEDPRLTFDALTNFLDQQLIRGGRPARVARS